MSVINYEKIVRDDKKHQLKSPKTLLRGIHCLSVNSAGQGAGQRQTHFPCGVGSQFIRPTNQPTCFWLTLETSEPPVLGIPTKPPPRTHKLDTVTCQGHSLTLNTPTPVMWLYSVSVSQPGPLTIDMRIASLSLLKQWGTWTRPKDNTHLTPQKG